MRVDQASQLEVSASKINRTSSESSPLRRTSNFILALLALATVVLNALALYLLYHHLSAIGFLQSTPSIPREDDFSLLISELTILSAAARDILTTLVVSSICAISALGMYALAFRITERSSLENVSRQLEQQKLVLGSAEETIGALESFLESSLLMIAVVEQRESSMMVLSSNRPFRNFLNLPELDATSEHHYDAIALNDYDKEWLLQEIGGAIESDESVRVERRLKGPKGAVWTSVTVCPVKGKNDEPTQRAVLFLEDISQRHESEEALRENEARLRAMNDASPIGLFVTDSRGRATYINQELRRIMKLARGDALGTTWTKFIDKEDRRTLLNQLKRWQPNTPILPSTVTLKTSLGDSFWASIRIAPILNDKKVLGYAASIEDRTLQREIEQQLVNQTEAAEAATRSKSVFLANMSHEIRTPLTSIIGFGESLLAGDIPPEDHNRILSLMIKSGRHLMRVINDILDLSKIEAGKMEIEQVDTSLSELLTDLESLLRLQAEEKGLQLDFLPTFPLPAVIVSDPIRLKQIFINLLGNAIKFTEVGKVIFSMSYDSEQNSLVCRIIDTGRGMDESERSKLFRAFSQGDASMTRRFGGTGLGLRISRELCHRMGGTITVDSRLGHGSTFTVVLPLTEKDKERVVDSFEGDTTELVLCPLPKSDALLQGEVLLIEDGLENQEIISFLLKKLGLSVTIASNGLEGVATARRKSFDLILLDHQMPVMDGLTAASLIRRDGYTGKLVALTANSMPSDIEASRAAGCDDFMPKPFERAHFIERVQLWIEGNRKEQQTGITRSAA